MDFSKLSREEKINLIQQLQSRITSQKMGPVGPIQGEVMKNVPEASGAVEEVPGPITNALLMGVGGLPSKAVTEAAPVIQAAGKGLARAGEVIAAPLKSTSEAAINAAEQAAGVTLKAPVTKQIAKEVGLPKGQQTFADVTNAIKSQLESGAKIPLQTAKDFLNKADTVFKQPIGKTEKAALSQTVKLVRDYLNTEIKGRAKPAADLANAYLRSNLLKGATGVGAAVEAIRRLSRWGR